MSVVDPDEPLPFAIAPGLSFALPPPVRVRLEIRCRAEHMVDAAGRPDLRAFADRELLEEGSGHLTIAAAHRLIYDKSDRDRGVLVREMVRAVLVRDGFYEAAARL